MNEGMNQPQHPRNNRKSRRRKRNFGSQNNRGQQNSPNNPGGPGGGGGGGPHRQNRNNRGGQRRGGSAFVGPMDHSYRNQGNGAGQQGARFHNGVQATPNMEPLNQREDAPTRIFAFIDDLFFVAKIQEISRKLDLNSNSIKPLAVISKMRSKYKKNTSIVGFVSHVQGDLKVKAQEAGCDVVMPRSAFSQNLPNILRRHGAEDEVEDNFNKA
jgi:hypothetical protein